MPQTNSQPQIDQTALNLSRSIRDAEGGDYTNFSGDAGTSAGAYQWNNGKIPLQKGQVPANFRSSAQRLGLNPDDFSPTNQDHVAYEEIKADLDSGLTQSQIAAKWNSGLTHGWETHKGTTTINGKTISYDTPAYVEKVKNSYLKYTQGAQPSDTGSYNPTPYSNPTKPNNPGQFDLSGTQATTDQPAPSDQSFVGQVGSDVAKRSTEIGAGATKALGGASDILQGNLVGGATNVFNGLLQGTGSAAGLLGDVTNRVLEDTPVVGDAVRGVESLIGQGAGALAQTSIGQSVVKQIGDFATAHPEIAKDIGAGLNIVTAIPIFKGLSALKGVVGDAAAQALKGVAEKGATRDLATTIARTKSGAQYLTRNPDVVKTLVDERALPEVADGKFTVDEAKAKLGDSISHIEDTEMKPLLSSANSPAVSSRFAFDNILKEAEAAATDAQEDFAPVKKELSLIQKKFGDYPTLQQINDAKRIVSKKISEAAFNSPDASAMKIVRSTLQKSVEDGAKALGLEDVSAINQKMARLIKAQDALKYIDRKPVKLGTVGGIIQDAATAGGETLGNMSGIPIAGALTGRQAGGFVGKRLANLTTGILNRTGKDAVQTSIKGAGKKVAKGLISAPLQKATKGL